MPKLTICLSDKEERTFEFEGGVVTIGRAETNSIQLDDPAAEPLHCQIEATPDGRFKLVDLETRSGTEVDGIKVNAHFLESGDRIYIGDMSIVYEDADELAKTKTRRIPILKARRLGRIPTRRDPPALRRRVGALPPPGDEHLTIEDLRCVLASLVAQSGPEVLEEARQALEQFYEEHHGQPLYDGLMTELDNLYRMMEINKHINSEHNLKKLLELIMDSVIEMAGAERGFLILRERESLVIKVARNFDRESIKKPEFKVSHSVAEEVLRTGKPIISADALCDPNLPPAGSVTDLKLRSLLCIPFRVREQVLGCVYIDNRFETDLFSEDDLPLLQGFADQAAIAIENARLFEENLRDQDELKRSRDEIERLNDQLKAKVEKQYAEIAKMKQDLDSTRPDVPLKHDFSSIIGASRAMKDLFHLLDRVIDTDEPIFVHGESGTGKELVARSIHFNSSRAKSGKFVSENCSAIPDTLLESELFGHEKGAFTGATSSKPGLFELAHKGTLFLDEIGDMSFDMQKKLLRAIQEGEIRRVGGKDVIKVDVRMVSASNKDLADLIKTGHFREDLYYRLNVVKLTLPPLRDRKDDIPVLVEHFLEKIARDNGLPKRRIDEPAFWYLQNYSWPGNVRELENEIRRAVALSDGLIMVDNLKDEIKSKDLFKPQIRIAAGTSLKEIVREATEEVERKVIARALDESGWKKTEAAAKLGVSRPTLDAKIEQYGLARGLRGARPVRTAAALIVLLPLLPAEAQDDKAWLEAVALFRAASASRDPVDRYQSIDELRKTSTEKVEKQYWLMVLGALRQEIGREGAGGKTEEKVSGEVLESCLKALRKISTPAQLAEMLKLARAPHENVRVRAYLIWALGEKGDLKDLTELVEDKSPVVQIAATDVLAERADASSLPLFFRLLSENRTWELKWSCLVALEKLADEKSIEPLIESLGRCRADEGRLKDQYIRILRKLLESKLDSDDPSAWKAVWQAKKSGAESAPGTTMADMTQFYGLKTRSTRLVFVLDKTGSMMDAGSEPEHPAYTLPTEATGVDKEPAPEKAAREECSRIVKRWAGTTAKTRIEVAKKELISTLFVLSPKVHFNILWYEALPSPWKLELVPATWTYKLEAMTATDKVIASGGTNIWDALELAFKMVEVPAKTGPNPVVLDRKLNYAVATGGADTFFLMTDGRPTMGKLLGTDEVIGELRKVNRLRKVTIHTICVGDRAPGSAIVDGPDPAFLKRIADQNNGDFVHIRK